MRYPKIQEYSAVRSSIRLVYKVTLGYNFVIRRFTVTIHAPNQVTIDEYANTYPLLKGEQLAEVRKYIIDRLNPDELYWKMMQRIDRPRKENFFIRLIFKPQTK